MTREEAIKTLKEARQALDTECAHGVADAVLCSLLTSLGYSDVVDEYKKVPKWFA